MSGALNTLKPVVLPPPAAQQAPQPATGPRIPLTRRLAALVRETALGGLLGIAASGLAYAAGIFAGIGEPRLAAAFATGTVLIVLYVVMVSPLDPAILEDKE